MSNQEVLETHTRQTLKVLVLMSHICRTEIFMWRIAKYRADKWFNINRKDRQAIGQRTRVVQSELSSTQSRVSVRPLLPQHKRQRIKLPKFFPCTQTKLLLGCASSHFQQELTSRVAKLSLTSFYGSYIYSCNL